jgi:DNA-3-methyladenine glycosylase I
LTPERCSWVGNDPLMTRYHDEEWGEPVHDDRKLFEYMVLDAFQSGLSWRVVLGKRAGFDAAFAHFEPAVVAGMSEADVARLVADSRIIRNRLKIAATIHNARRVAEVQAECGSLAAYLWQFTGGRVLQHGYVRDDQIGATSPESDAMSNDLRRRGFKFMGSTVVYAFMQGAGMVNDHVTGCFRYAQLAGPH